MLKEDKSSSKMTEYWTFRNLASMVVSIRLTKLLDPQYMVIRIGVVHAEKIVTKLTESTC